ncbi:hypothetical protein K504DRAFT_460961 [Pleomassaria siparia CBS 279.74]|uniref:Uncharacterized protein n=1 Tax=Pleomassaria siparia CBS 279.74 TaxID=1314801 RepID=A0A6G1JVQ9_9PLEO|nr:hypothetical protein K504DRAFT_460961 [Pleomassaria siparia CBS 279.74]
MIAPSGRSGCRNPECKNKDMKIQKGELGPSIAHDWDGHTAWVWKHRYVLRWIIFIDAHCYWTCVERAIKNEPVKYGKPRVKVAPDGIQERAWARSCYGRDRSSRESNAREGRTDLSFISGTVSIALWRY